MDISIGLIDSGIDTNSSLINSNYVFCVSTDDSKNPNGSLKHGTYCAHLIQRSIPNSFIYDLKVFDKSLVTSPTKIIKAINLCLEKNVKIINLSLSINDANYYYEFKRICDEAFFKGAIIVASADNNGRVCLPAYLDNVIGVGIAQTDNEDDYYYTTKPIQIYANGQLKIDSSDNRPATSFATAKITGLIARIMLKTPGIDFNELQSILRSKALPFDSQRIVIENQDFSFSKNTEPIILPNDIIPLKKFENTIFVGEETEVNLLKDHPNLLTLNIKNLLNPVQERPFDFKSTLSSTLQIKLKLPETFNDSLQNCDSIILGSLPDHLQQEIVDKSIAKKGSIELFKVFNTNKPDNIQSLFHNNMGKIVNELTNIPTTHILNNQLPILGIIDLTNRKSVYSVELTVREELLKRKHKVGHISSNPLSEMLGLNYSFANYIQIPFELQAAYARALVESVNNSRPDSEIIIIGMAESITTEDKSNLHFFSTHNISMIHGFQPDAIVFVIDELVEPEFIVRNINCAENLLTAKVPLLINKSLSSHLDPSKFQIPNYDKMLEASKLKMDKIICKVKRTKDLPIMDINKSIDTIIKIIQEEFQLY